MALDIPQNSPYANVLAHKAEIEAAMARVLASGWYILGEEVAAFEREFAAFLDVPHAVGVASGTDAIHIALRGLGIGAGDLVATVSHTAVATVAAIELAGAAPLLADIDPETYTMDPASLQSVMGPKVKAIIPVHLYGHPAALAPILKIAESYGAAVIEDCAQSHGAKLDGRATGTWGRVGAFSFYPTKNLGALGDGGAVVTSDAGLAARIRSLREYGWRERYVSSEAGLNSRLDEMQAAILRVKLRYLELENARRREIALWYGELLADLPLTLPTVADGATHVFHQYVVRTVRRDALREHLKQSSIGALIHYPVPVHLQPAYRDRVTRADSLAATEAAAREVLSLPMYPELRRDQVERVCAAVRGFFTGRAAR
ncbi:MAG: DegT/DnrJ/EryC1/StrS family aminotransferase [Acidobacteriales bacterium]|nr:DegT/DnrJ/EryC1/StrS family aminotransferase [Terriglobales bacterium]